MGKEVGLRTYQHRGNVQTVSRFDRSAVRLTRIYMVNYSRPCRESSCSNYISWFYSASPTKHQDCISKQEEEQTNNAGGKEDFVSSYYSEIRLKGLRKNKSKILMYIVTFRVMTSCILIDGSQPRSGFI